MTELRKHALLGDDVFTVPGLVTDSECCELIQFSEAVGYEPAAVSTAGGPQLLPEWRNNERVMVDDRDRAAWLRERAASFIPRQLGDWRLTGINERLRFYRYDPGQKFDWHCDGFFSRPNGERSFLTFMVYLNSECLGGETSFRGTDAGRFADFSVVPETGTALFFKHELLHKGEPVTRGRKYVLRTDVMYSR